MVKPIGCFMAYVHHTVHQISKIYLQNEKRFNYTTPKTFLEYIFLYRKLLVEKNREHTERIQRLQSGMSKLAECACQVDALKVGKFTHTHPHIRSHTLSQRRSTKKNTNASEIVCIGQPVEWTIDRPLFN